MAFTNNVRVDTLRTVAFGGIGSSYATFGISFAHRMRMIKITNNTDGDLFIAFTRGSTPASDGSEDNDFVPAGSFVLYDFTSNSEATSSPFVFQVGTQVWVRYSSAPTVKSVYLTCVYGKGE